MNRSGLLAVLVAALGWGLAAACGVFARLANPVPLTGPPSSPFYVVSSRDGRPGLVDLTTEGQAAGDCRLPEDLGSVRAALVRPGLRVYPELLDNRRARGEQRVWLEVVREGVAYFSVYVATDEDVFPEAASRCGPEELGATAQAGGWAALRALGVGLVLWLLLVFLNRRGAG